MIQTSFFPQPEKDKPIQIIQKIDTSILQPRKVEDLLPHIDILPDSYMIYPTGGYHPFYGVPNTFPRYQLPIWPYIKRIKFSDRYSEKGIQAIRDSRIDRTRTLSQSQLNCSVERGYHRVTLKKHTRQKRFDYTVKLKNGNYKHNMRFDNHPCFIHRLVALAWIPNPENKPFVLHINDDSTNYFIENLKWGTGGDNQRGSLRVRPDTMEQKYLDLVNKEIIKG